MLELRIISPQENGFVQEIEWNNEELKTAISKKMEDYKGLVFTEETIADIRPVRQKPMRMKRTYTGSVWDSIHHRSEMGISQIL